MMRRGEENEQIKEDFQTVMNGKRGEQRAERHNDSTDDN
jgi:hypothetical protein